MTPVPVSEIVTLVNGRYGGPEDLAVSGVATLADAREDQLSFLGNPKYASQVAGSRAGLVLVPEALPGDDVRFLRVKDVYFALSQILTRWFATRPAPDGISPQAVIATTAKLGHNVRIGPFVAVGEDVTIGDDVTIYANVTIEPGSVIGDGTTIHANAAIYHGSRIGRRCVIHSGAVIGSDGYGFATHGGRHHKIPQIGIVRLEDDVEIGAGTTIDRAALGETVIGEGTKVDNLVQIGHNVRVGKHCLLVSQVGIAGSTVLGDYVVVAGQSGFAGHLSIGNRVQVAAKSAVLADVADGEKVMGTPAVPFREFARREATLRRMMKKRRNEGDEG
jgi:UDP-3-O-[3-hydroxymyristoyl] glucosamine N-acyltransferase